MGVTLMAALDRQHRRTQHVALGRRIPAGPAHRAFLHPEIEQTADLAEVGEERQLPERCDRRRGVPFDVHATTECV